MNVTNYDDKGFQALCDEANKLDWINRALKNQIAMNENRIAEINKILLDWREKK